MMVVIRSEWGHLAPAHPTTGKQKKGGKLPRITWDAQTQANTTANEPHHRDILLKYTIFRIEVRTVELVTNMTHSDET